MMEQPILLKSIEYALEELQTIPLWGSPPAFPWEIFSENLTKNLEQDIVLSHHQTAWRSKNELLEGMGDHPLIAPFDLSPLPGSFFFVMPKENQATLTQLLLTKEGKSKGFSDETLSSGFAHFVFLNVLDTFNQLNLYGNLTASFAEETPLPEEGALCIDVSIKCGNKSLWGRVLCPRETHASFQSYFTMEKPPFLSDPTFASLPLSLHLEVGNTTLTASEWQQVDVGDFILLERCTYDVAQRRGTAILALANTPLFDVRIKEGEAKILEYALIQEEHPMTEEENTYEEEPTEMEGEEERPLWSSKNGEEKLTPSGKAPITLTAEVGRFQMPLEKVTQLKPGNVLEIGLSPEPNIHLTIGGKRVAKGELVRIGEALGVKILTLGD